MRAIFAATLLLACRSPVTASEGESPEPGEEAKLIAVLGSEAPIFEKAQACERLALIGTRAAVPALAGLLGDARLGHYARFGLEPIPDASVDEALRASLARLEGGLLVGAIGSIGVRRDPGAVEVLAPLLSRSDGEVVSAAASALGRIGTPAAAASLRKELDRPLASRDAAIARGALLCADSARARGDLEEAAGLCDVVRAAKVPGHLRLEATRGAILARGANGLPLLIETLRAENFADFALGLGIAREMSGEQVTPAVVDSLGRIAPDRRALLLDAIAERGGPAALAALLGAAKRGGSDERRAAMKALGKLKDPAALPVLLEAAAGDDPLVAQAAVDSLAALPGKDVDEAILSRLARGEGKERLVAIRAAGRRRLAEALPALRKAATAEGDEDLRIAGIAALGDSMGTDDVPFLLGRLPAASGKEAAAIIEALEAASRRAPDREAWAGMVLEKDGTGSATAIRFLEALRAIGGAKAAAAVAARAGDRDPAVRKAAIEVLGQWLDESGPRVLLDIVRSTAESEARLAALRAWCDRVRTLRLPKEARLALCREGLLEVARGPEEKKVAIFACRGIPAVETMDLLIPHLENPDLADDVCEALVGMSQRVIRFQPEAVARSMKLVLATSKKEDLRKTAGQLLRNAGGAP